MSMSQDMELGGDAARPRSDDPNAPENTQARSAVIDGSEWIYAIYLEMSLRVDKELVHGWNQAAKSILLFSGLLAATVGAALGPSLDPNMDQDGPVKLLKHIDQNIANFTNGQLLPLNDTLSVSGCLGWLNSTLSDGASSHWQNILITSFPLVQTFWFLSLAISLTCAMWAILLQHWASRYLMAVQQRRDAVYSHARIREFLAQGIHDSRMAILVDLLRLCHQLSFLLFTLGLLVYLFRPKHFCTTFFTVLLWSASWLGLYLLITLAGIFRNNFPYHTPFLSLIHHFMALVTPHPHTWSSSWAATLKFRGISATKAIEESVEEHSRGLDGHILKWTFVSLNQDNEFERFFEGIPDFCKSRAVEHPVKHLNDLNGEGRLSRVLVAFMHRTFTSHLIEEPARRKRTKICMRVIDAVPKLASGSTLRHVFEEWEGILGSVDSGSAVLWTGGDRNSDPHTIFCARCIVAFIIARAQACDDDSWLGLTTKFLTSDMEVWAGISQPTLRVYLQNKYDALLANLIFISRIIFQFHSEHSRDIVRDVSSISSTTLSKSSSNIDIRLASPDMQRMYCDLWNELVHQAQDASTGPYESQIAKDILKYLRKGYVALHESTDAAPSSYPLCDVQSHRRTSLQTTANLPIPHPSPPPLSASISPNAGVPITADADDPSNVSSLAEWPESAHDIALAPMPPRPPPAVHRPSLSRNHTH